MIVSEVSINVVSFSIVNFFNLLVENINLFIEIESPIREIALFKKPLLDCEFAEKKEKRITKSKVYLKILVFNILYLNKFNQC